MKTRRARVWAAIDEARLRALLLNLIDIYSPSGKEEDIQLYLEDYLCAAGCRVERLAVDDERYNLIATMGDGAPLLYLVGHVDTVPAWDLECHGWREEGGTVFGLGSCDMKGGGAAMVEAWLALATALEGEEQPPVGLLLVVGEEEDGDGSAAFLKEHRPPWAIIGEPTGLSPCFAHYGYLEAGFVTRGQRSHSSLPELGHNAVESLLRVLLHLGNDPLLRRDSSELVYSIRELRSSRAGFVVPDRCEAWIDLHLPPGYDPQRVQHDIRRLATAAGRSIPGLDLELAFDFAAAGYRLADDSPYARLLPTLYAELGLELRLDAFRSHSDGNLFFAAGTSPLILGPGSLETAHTPNEQLPLAELYAAARIYAALCLAADADDEEE